MDQFLKRAFEGFLDTVDSRGFTTYDFMEYVKRRYPKRTPASNEVGHLCRRSSRVIYDPDERCYMVIA